jgi:tRNA threonylcarbamoyladenosine biosynthesis protein TsaB
MNGRMNTLVMDTSSKSAAIGLGLRSGAHYTDKTDGSQKHGRDLIPRIAMILASGGLRPAELEVIGVCLGPGSYTGLRVGVTAAKTLSYATGAVIVGLDSLEAVAWNAPDSVLRVSVVADAQRGDVYSADFIREAQGGPLSCTRTSQIEALDAWLARLAPGTLVLGPGLDSPRIAAQVPVELLSHVGELNYPEGARLLGLADREYASGRRENAWPLEPRYLRKSAAEEKWEARGPIASA